MKTLFTLKANKLTHRRPNYFTGFNDPPTYFRTKHAILKDEYIANFAKNGAVFSVTEGGKWLMATMPNKSYWVIGIFERPVPKDWFPKW